MMNFNQDMLLCMCAGNKTLWCKSSSFFTPYLSASTRRTGVQWFCYLDRLNFEHLSGLEGLGPQP
jgi:hypothetical protein